MNLERPRGNNHHELWRNPAEVIAKGKAELSPGEPIIERLAVAPLPLRIKHLISLTEKQIKLLELKTELGTPHIEIVKNSMFDMFVYGDKTTGEEHVAIVKGLLSEGNKQVPIRIHSSCLTAETFSASNCDCQEQLDQSLAIADREGIGGVIWLHQEGRGNGLAAKAEQLKRMIYEGMNTVEAFESMGLPSEQRDFTAAVDILKDLGIDSVKLITNNPEKVAQTRALGINVEGLIPCIVEPINEIVRNDLRAKRDKHGHYLSTDL
ncbi:MAG TPA: GTP cyclohydrolase II RibA [Candidatus Levybacteria bacterium]|nr:GTP cyclohydrolase II RibA [Candidatus Levybacteria bacterium]